MGLGERSAGWSSVERVSDLVNTMWYFSKKEMIGKRRGCWVAVPVVPAHQNPMWCALSWLPVPTNCLPIDEARSVVVGRSIGGLE